MRSLFLFPICIAHNNKPIFFMAKKNFIIQLFDDIAPTYDKLNHLLSMNIDKQWRKKAVRTICQKQPQTALDIACGTGDFAIALAQAGIPHVTGIDISEGMLEVGRKKVAALGLNIDMKVDDCEQLNMADGSVDAISAAFGVRNFEHLQKGLEEMHRVLRNDGFVCILELSVPQNPVLCWIYKLYFMHVLPFFGGLISGNRSAYEYLPNSVLNFPKPDKFCSMLSDAGFKQVKSRSLTFGLCRMFTGVKE